MIPSRETDPQNYYTLASLLSSMAHDFLEKKCFMWKQMPERASLLKNIAELLLQAKNKLGQGPFLNMLHEECVYVEETFIQELEDACR